MISRQHQRRIHRCATEVRPKMQMRPRYPPGRADDTQRCFAGNSVSFGNVDAIQVTVHCDKSLAMIDKHRIAIKKVIAGGDDHSIKRCDDSRSQVCRDVHAAVR